MLAEEMDPAEVFMNEIIARNKTMDVITARGDSPVQQFYSGTTVFVTGGTGFLGKQLIEKLLRATKISKVFVLLRPKKDQSVEERLKSLLEDPVYDIIRKTQPDFAAKISPVAGDVAELKLGISDEDWETLGNEVEIIFHMAATTRFDAPLRETTMINIRGTREALALGKACKNLKSYVHVSTAYSQACIDRVNAEVLEDFYQSPVDPETLIKLAESIEERRLDYITPGLITNWPNTYSFAKAIAEELVRTSSELPICIVRPAIVINAIREPQPGWVDKSNVFGASGVALGTGLGLMHTIYADDKVRLGFIPVDYVNNAIIAAGWKTGVSWTAGQLTPKIYTLITSCRNPADIGHSIGIIKHELLGKYNSPKAVAYANFKTTNNSAMYWMQIWLLHLIPAYVIDGFCSLAGKEIRFVKLYSKMCRMMTLLSFYCLNNWDFDDRNTAKLYDCLSEADKQIFEFDIEKINWHDFITLWGLGLRKFIVKDGLKDTKYALKKQFYMKMAACVALPIYFYALYKILFLILYLLSLVASKLF